MTYIPTATDTVSLELVTANGCAVFAETIVVVIPQRDTTEVEDEINVYIPNVFNPTSQNPSNRQFTIQFTDEVLEVSYFRVFDRWGALVFEVTDIAGSAPIPGWDGSHKGKIVNPGVFVYTVEYRTSDGSSTVLYGDVTVIR